MIWEHFRK